MTLGTRIAQQRKKLGLSQEALGQRMGVSRQAISKWEADAAVPEIDKLIVLSRLFEVSVGWLLGIDESPAETDTWSGSLGEIHYSAEARLDPVLLLENLTSGDVVEAVLEIRVKDGPIWRETVEIWDPKELW